MIKLKKMIREVFEDMLKVGSKWRYLSDEYLFKGQPFGKGDIVTVSKFNKNEVGFTFPNKETQIAKIGEPIQGTKFNTGQFVVFNRNYKNYKIGTVGFLIFSKNISYRPIGKVNFTNYGIDMNKTKHQGTLVVAFSSSHIEEGVPINALSPYLQQPSQRLVNERELFKTYVNKLLQSPLNFILEKSTFLEFFEKL